MSAITADFDTLMDRASATAYSYMLSTVHNIDQTFGEGYAKAHPVLVGAMVQAASLDFVGAILRQGLDNLANQVAESIDYPTGLTIALDGVAAALASNKLPA